MTTLNSETITAPAQEHVPVVDTNIPASNAEAPRNQPAPHGVPVRGRPAVRGR
jgi:hypothetical protein